MGYDVQIARLDDRTDGEAKSIRLEEWLDYVHGDSEMRLDGVAEVRAPDGTTIRYENPGLAVWTAGGETWFDFRNGRVVVKNPDDRTLTKMVAIAEKLGARVQGEEGERYDSETPAAASSPARPWWQRLFRR